MSKYIPKIGEDFEWRADYSATWYRCGAVVAKTEKSIAYLNGTGFIEALTIEHCVFRPIPTEADVEREQLVEIIKEVTRDFGNFDGAAEGIQKAGFTIPKKVSFRDLSQSMVGYGMNQNLEQWWEEEGKELLGDLVESDND